MLLHRLHKRPELWDGCSAGYRVYKEPPELPQGRAAPHPSSHAVRDPFEVQSQTHRDLTPDGALQRRQAELQSFEGLPLLRLKVRLWQHAPKGLAPQAQNRQHPRRVSSQLIPTGLEQGGDMLSRQDVGICGQAFPQGVRCRNVHQVHVQKFRSIVDTFIRKRSDGLKAEEKLGAERPHSVPDRPTALRESATGRGHW